MSSFRLRISAALFGAGILFGAFPLAAQRTLANTGGSLPSVSPDGRHIAFNAVRDGKLDTYVIRSDGAGETRLAATSENDGAPDWIGSGVLTWRRVRDTTVVDVLPVPDARGASGPQLQSAVHAVVVRPPSDAREVRATRDGRRILFTRGDWRQSRISTSNLDGSDLRDVTPAGVRAFNPAWSPDARRIAFTTADSAFHLAVAVMDADGANFRIVARLDSAEGSPQWPAWSPDGKRLAIQAGKYSREHPDRNTAHIWIVDVATARATKLSPHARPYLDETPSWFPDGTRIAFQSDRTGIMHVWTMKVDGSDARQITSWSP